MSKDTGLLDALDEGLDALVAGGAEELNRILGRDPGSPNARLWEIAKMASVELKVSVDAAVAAAHVRTIMDAARGTVSVTRPRKVTALRRLVIRPLAALSAAVIFAAPAAAAAASEAGPGDSLYGTKIAIENVRLAFERDPLDDADLHIDFANERIAEIHAAAGSGRTRGLETALSNLQGHLDAASAALDSIEGSDLTDLSERLQVARSHHVDVLNGLAENAGCDTEDPEAGKPQCKGLLNAIENSSKHLDHLPPALTGGSSKDGPGKSEDHKPTQPGQSGVNPPLPAPASSNRENKP